MYVARRYRCITSSCQFRGITREVPATRTDGLMFHVAPTCAGCAGELWLVQQ